MKTKWMPMIDTEAAMGPRNRKADSAKANTIHGAARMNTVSWNGSSTQFCAGTAGEATSARGRSRKISEVPLSNTAPIKDRPSKPRAPYLG